MGWLMAQALTNRCTLGLPVAPLLFHLLTSLGGAKVSILQQVIKHRLALCVIVDGALPALCGC
jgi:hypothetical protein